MAQMDTDKIKQNSREKAQEAQKKPSSLRLLRLFVAIQF